MKDFRNRQKCNLRSEWDTCTLNTSQSAQSIVHHSPRHMGLSYLESGRLQPLPDSCTLEEVQKFILTQITPVSGSIAYIPPSVKMGYPSKESADQRHRF